MDDEQNVFISLCQCIDSCRHSASASSSPIARLRNWKTKRKLRKCIRKYNRIPITSSLLSIFYIMYNGYGAIEFDEVEWYEKATTMGLQFNTGEYTILITVSRYPTVNNIISVTVYNSRSGYSYNYTYTNKFNITCNGITMHDKVAIMCEDLLREYIVTYLLARIEV